ncbi:MAG: hypothetical protein ACLQAH_06090 [Limisphaerales bacterium]
MKIQIDIKSALLGIVVGIVAVLAIGAGTSSNEVGRYQISTTPNFAIIIDTKTGQAWGSIYTQTSNSSIRNDPNFFDTK